jgi:hypothetical protein
LVDFYESCKLSPGEEILLLSFSLFCVSPVPHTFLLPKKTPQKKKKSQKWCHSSNLQLD